MSDATDYPVATPDGMAPNIFRAQIMQTMALRYFNHMRGVDPPFTMEEAHEAAMDTWSTEWPDDPAPRTLEAAIEVTDGDLAYWVEE
ncbi:MAG: hypothetical protein VYA35_10660 [Pseudomonadota bacterium]|nr:hypothetical protein [Pseudomonadota bacterium]